MSIDCRKAIGLRIKAIRTRRRLTQERLAEAVGKSTDNISNIERGEQGSTIETYCDIARVLAVPLRDLFDFEGLSEPLDRKEVEMKAQLFDIVRQLQKPDLGVALRQLQALAER